MQHSTKGEWRSIVRGNAPVRYERDDGEWVEVRSTRVDERSVYEVAGSRGQISRYEKYYDAVTEALRRRGLWDRLMKRRPGHA
jgi:hypothetical protein